LIDIDGKNPPTRDMIVHWLNYNTVKELQGEYQATIEETEHGYHLYIWLPLKQKTAYFIIRTCPYSDSIYARLGFERGFWFLMTKRMFEPPVPVTFMAIRGGNWFDRKNDN
jgi:hypothetical protein